MSGLFRLENALRRNAAVDAWMIEHTGELGMIAHCRLEVMRHVKLKLGCDVDSATVTKLINSAYTDMKSRL
ncbi:MAG: hypothetical protein HKN43_13265 [Rhodothermales bacterium]|nr:hypothetical protein [Rhodothermales bacterium]